MGNAQPTNKTGKSVTAQKLETAKKVGVLSLTEHGLQTIPNQIYEDPDLRKIRTLDLSKNKLRSLGKLGELKECKSLNLDHNLFHAGSIQQVNLLTKLQNLSASNNKLGLLPPADPHNPKARGNSKMDPLPDLPGALKQVSLASNSFTQIPRHLYAPHLTRLEKLDLSDNELVVVPAEIVNLANLQELNCDRNMIVSLPEAIGGLKKLKALSLRNNKLSVSNTVFSAKNPQPLPKSLFTDTLLIDLNLHGNRMTNTQLNQFDGYQEFLDRRQKVKLKTMTNLDVCGLD